MSDYEKINRRFEKLFFGGVKKAINGKFNSLISVIRERGVSAGYSWLTTDLLNPDLVKEIQRLYRIVGVRHANITTRDLKKQEKNSFIYLQVKGFGFNAEWVQFMMEYLKLHLIERITFDVNATTRNFLMRVLNRSINEGMGVDETVRLLDGSGFSEMQAARIVRTEVNRAANVGVLAAGGTYEWEMQKEWVSVHDFRTRGTDPDDHASHVELGGTVIDFDDSFVDSRNGDHLQSPGDPKASAASTINCRCHLTLKPKRDSRGRLIPKRKTTTVIYPNQNRRYRTVTV